MSFNPSLPVIAGVQQSAPMSLGDIDRMANAAWSAFELMRQMPDSQIADFLECYAELFQTQIGDIGAAAHAEVGLPLVRLTLPDKEAGRTWNQLAATGRHVRKGWYRHPTIDTATNMRSMLRPIGPIINLEPDNFPLAFNSMSGGIWAAGTAARCPVIGKAHRDLSRTGATIVHGPLSAAVRHSNMPLEMINWIPGGGDREIMHALLRHPRIRGGAMTGSKKAGLALAQTAAEMRKPFIAEMESPGYTVVLPGMASQHGAALAGKFYRSMELGNLFCTCINTLFIPAGTESAFETELVKLVTGKEGASRALADHHKQNFEAGCKRLSEIATLVAEGPTHDGGGELEMRARVYKVDFATWLQHPDLWEEVFGWCTLIVTFDSFAEFAQVFDHQPSELLGKNSLPGSLTFGIWGLEEELDSESMSSFLYSMELWAGRLLMSVNPADDSGVAPGLPVGWATMHGGPFPATNHDGFTMVGMNAPAFFMVSRTFQGWVDSKLPLELQRANPLQISRLVDGNWTKRAA